ncbi:MAG: hypothetical protein JW913_00675 [Chitinispirillaceae bacterium]|nr:hypothetical protein [Chitinispirillaceae bacterium]
MEKIRGAIFKNLWMAFPCVLLLLFVAGIRYVHLPLGRRVVAEGTRLFRHYVKKQDASGFPRQEERLRTEIALLDSVLKRIEARSLRRKGALVEELYSYADSAGFKTGKVEVGMPQSVAGHREIAIGIEGSGPYRSTGAFIERIENSSHSTRIRQLIIKAQETGNPDVFIDLTVREEKAE